MRKKRTSLWNILFKKRQCRVCASIPLFTRFWFYTISLLHGLKYYIPKIFKNVNCLKYIYLLYKKCIFYCF